MLDAIMFKAYKAYLDFQLKLMEIENSDAEDGFGAIETIILLAIAVIIAVIIYKVLTGGDQEGGSGLIGQMFEGIKEKLRGLGFEIS